MPIFSRRRLQVMLYELSPKLGGQQGRELLSRLENIDAKPALAAEMELGLLWAVSKVADVKPHTAIRSTGRKPEAFSTNLFPNASSYIEITSLSDDTFSDKDKMDRAANIICQFCETLRRGCSKNLSFEFATFSGAKDGRYQRYRLISSNFSLTDEMKEQIKSWITNANWPAPTSIRLVSKNVNLVMKWKKRVHSLDRTFSSMPPLAYDIEDNHLFKALQKKRRQLSGVSKGQVRCIFVADVGCELLKNLRPINPVGSGISGEQIIWHFLSKSAVEVVVVVSPKRSGIGVYRPSGDLRWSFEIFDRRQGVSEGDYVRLRAMAEHLPKPMFEGYQARSLHRQGALNPQRHGWYLGCNIRVEPSGEVSMKFSARLLQELLAGRITLEQFERNSGIAQTVEHELKSGKSIVSARIDSAGVDQDDDYVELTFAHDANASALKLTAPSF